MQAVLLNCPEVRFVVCVLVILTFSKCDLIAYSADNDDDDGDDGGGDGGGGGGGVGGAFDCPQGVPCQSVSLAGAKPARGLSAYFNQFTFINQKHFYPDDKARYFWK